MKILDTFLHVKVEMCKNKKEDQHFWVFICIIKWLIKLPSLLDFYF